MLKKRSLLMLVLGILLVGLLVACSDSEKGAGSGDGDNVVIDFMHLWPEGSSRQHNLIVQEIIDEFEAEHTNVKIELEILGNEQYKEKLSVIGASNELPDVGMTWAGGFLEPYVSGNMFAALDDIISDDFIPGTTEAYAVDGVTYGLPLELNITPIYYNQAIFDQVGVEVPETWDDFKDVVTTLVDAGITPITLGNRDAWTGSMWYMYLADRIGGPSALNDAISCEGS